MPQQSSVSPTVVAVVGSPRPSGNTTWAVDAALAELERRGVHAEKLMLCDYRIGPCQGHEDCAALPACAQDDDAAAVLERVYRADGLILATPVYYEDVSAQMKIFIDRNYRPYELQQRLQPKVAGLVVVAAETGIGETVAALKRFLALSWQDPMPIEVASGFASALGDAARSGELRAAAERMAARMADILLA
jgi:multimeric flavodoxin WrbA